MSATIAQDHLDSVCLPGKGETTCAFLMMTPGGMECAKGTGVETTIRQRLAEGTMAAKGDNCTGWTG